MITLEKGDKLFTDDNLVVHNGGVFEGFELVLVSDIKDIEKPIFQYQAIYIKEGVTYAG